MEKDYQLINRELTNELTKITHKLNIKDFQIRLNEAIYLKVFEICPIPLAIVSLDRTIMKCNQSLVDSLCYSNRKEIENQIRFDEITHPEDLDKDIELFNQLKRGEIDYYDIEKRYITRTGRIITPSLRASLIRDLDSKPIVAVGLFYRGNELRG